jgi:hypothetical protein
MCGCANEEIMCGCANMRMCEWENDVRMKKYQEMISVIMKNQMPNKRSKSV